MDPESKSKPNWQGITEDFSGDPRKVASVFPGLRSRNESPRHEQCISLALYRVGGTWGAVTPRAVGFRSGDSHYQGRSLLSSLGFI